MNSITVERVDGLWVVVDGNELLDLAGSNRARLEIAEVRGLYSVDEVECDACKHRWVAVHPYSLRLECPRCRRMVSI